MSKNDNEKQHCRSCSKRLIDEKIPICSRCILARKDKAIKFGEVLGVIVIAVSVGKASMNNNKK